MAQLQLVTLATVKNVMEMPNSVTKHDATLTGLIRGVSADFQEISDRIVDVGAQSEIFDAENFTEELKLRAWPVDTGQDFKVFYDALRAFGTETELDSSEYFLTPEEGKVDLFRRFWSAKTQSGRVGWNNRKTLKVTYTGGMAKMVSPAAGEEFWNLFPDIAEAVQFEVIREFKLKDNLGVAAVKIADQSTTIMEQRQRSKLFWRLAYQYGRAGV